MHLRKICLSLGRSGGCAIAMYVVELSGRVFKWFAGDTSVPARTRPEQDDGDIDFDDKQKVKRLRSYPISLNHLGRHDLVNTIMS